MTIWRDVRYAVRNLRHNPGLVGVAVVSAAGATIVLIGLTAAWAPARRAPDVDPAVTLREG